MNRPPKTARFLLATSRAGQTPSRFDGKSRAVVAYRALLKHLLAQQLVAQVA